MSASNRSETAPVKTNSASVFIIPVYTAAIFLSAALLFAVQPMFTKMVLPRFGGSPSVWSVAMVFFQGILLLGYAYADILTRFVRGPLALLIHLAVMLGGAVFLPVAIAKGWGLPPPDREQLFLLGLFGVSIGFPFFALSANGPLLQAWFARSGLAQAENPYFLYAASNIGSLLALFAYPFAAEPFSTLSFHGGIWRSGYYLLIALIALCGALVFFRREGEAVLPQAQSTEAAPAFGRMAFWVALAFVPSALMIAATTHITADVAAAPFLWVLPLSLYLISFILVFSQRRFVSASHLDQAAAVPAGPARADAGARYPHMADRRRCAPSADVLRHGDDMPRPDGRHASASSLSHPVLFLHVAGRRARWNFFRPDRSADLFMDRRIPASGGCGGAGAARTWPKQKEARLLHGVALVVIVALPGLHRGFSVIPPYNWIVWGAVVALVAVRLLP